MMSKKRVLRVLIVGGGVAGKELLRELKKNLKKHYKIIGFVDDDQKKQGKKINGILVLGKTQELSSLIKKYNIDEIFIAIPSAQGEVIRNIIEQCQAQKILFRIVPRLLEIVRGQVKLNQIRTVRIEDLLGRAIIKTEQEIFLKKFKGKKVFITGAAGSIGSELCKQLIQFEPSRLVMFDWWENGMFELELTLAKLSSNKNFQAIIGNIQDYRKIKKIIASIKPDVIFHAAAFKHVPLMQHHPDEAVKNNVIGSLNVAKAAYEEGTKKFVYISTDKAANPINIMGATKLLGELIISKYNENKRTKFLGVRFGNVLGSHGSVVPIFHKQILDGGPLTVTDPEMKRFFMTITEAVQLVLQASIMGKGGEMFVLDMGEQVKIEDLARLMIKLAGFTPDVDILIKYIGKRAGEKIYEELVTDKETFQKTSHKKIYKFQHNFNSWKKLDKILDGLQKAADDQDKNTIFNLLKKIAPNLQSIT